MKKWIVLTCSLFVLILVAGCSSPFTERGIQEDVQITAGDIPEEPSKDEIINKIKNNSSNEIDDIIEANFPFMGAVNGESTQAEIYATTQFTINELASALTNAIQPEKISEVIDDQQILIYPNYFVTLKVSPDDNDVLLIEVADDEFVRRNYSPSFLGTYFAFRILDDVLDADDWAKRRSRACKSANCYGGYTGIPSRGDTSFRGGGPGSGK